MKYSTSFVLAGILAAAVPARAENSRPGAQTAMEPLFDIDLQHTGEVKIQPEGAAEGEMVGGGEGTVQGPRVKGTLRWTLFENSVKDRCSMQLPGEIKTDDGAKIKFEAQGIAIVPDTGVPSQWAVAGAFRFQTSDKRYVWLNSVLALWRGRFDASTGKAHYSLYVPWSGQDGAGCAGGAASSSIDAKKADAPECR